jgi:hypothetical protein
VARLLLRPFTFAGQRPSLTAARTISIMVLRTSRKALVCGRSASETRAQERVSGGSPEELARPVESQHRPVDRDYGKGRTCEKTDDDCGDACIATSRAAPILIARRLLADLLRGHSRWPQPPKRRAPGGHPTYGCGTRTAPMVHSSS